jgi:hypothetical protein
MNQNLKDLYSYYPRKSYHFCKETDMKEIENLLTSKASCTWGLDGKPLKDTNVTILAHFSPLFKGDKPIIVYTTLKLD